MAGKINVNLTTIVQGFARATQQFNQLGQGINNLGKAAGLAGLAFTAFQVGMRGADFAVDAISGARDLERNLLGLKSVFEEVTPQMRNFSKVAIEVGLSQNEAAKASTFIGSVLKQSGFSIEETADLTERLVRLGTDLSLTYGYDVQEALMGMTALFRGEYDPIEKFGVAMKQSEINSELAARKLDHLTGAARRFAEQQIRVELLFQRSADAQGAFERGTGTLAVEQLKLAATFNNMRDTVAMNLLPALGQLTQSLRESLEGYEPEIKEIFNDLVPIIQSLNTTLMPALAKLGMAVIETFGQVVKLIGAMLDPTTRVGESVSALFIQIQSLFQTITGEQLTIEAVFAGITEAVRFVADAIQSVIYFIENTVIGLKVLGEMAHAFFTGDWSKLFNTDWTGQIKSQIAIKDAVNAQRLAVAQLNQEIANQKDALERGNRAWANSWMARGEWAIKQGLVPDPKTIITGTTPDADTKTKKAIKDYVAEFQKDLQDEIQKQTAAEQLRLRGASEGLISSILAGDGWMKVWQQIKSGKIVLDDLQKQFNKTAAGAKELASAAKEAAKEIEDYNEKVAAINARLEEELRAIAEKAKEAKMGFADLLAGFDVLPTIERAMGRFEEQFVSQLDSIESSLKSAFQNKDILEDGYNALRNFARAELALLQQIGRQRDELAERFDLAKGLIDNYKRAFTAALDLTSLFGQLKQETETRTVTSVSRALMRLGGSMREFEVTISSTYEETIGGIQNKTQGILEGFRAMAEKARAFAENLRKLREMGLDPMLFNQLVEAGIEAGGETAQALVDGGSETINELNSIFKEIDAVGASLGEEVASSLYGTGIDMANGLLEGIRSKQAELENQARVMAQAFNAAFQASLSVQVDIAAKAAADAARATAASEIAAIPVPEALKEPPKIDEAALARIRELIAQASAYIANVGDATKRAGALVKRDIYSSLEQDILAGRAIDLSGIRSGMTTAELTSAAAVARGQTVNNFTINVTADTRTGGARAGEATVEALTKFGAINGNFNVQVAV
jgi:uncharacterized tellurite resistance protein B-like protein/phage-related protein